MPAQVVDGNALTYGFQFRAELETATVAGLIPSSEPVSYQQAQKLPYLQAVISEGLRVHSPPGVPLSREVPKGGAEVAGTFFPEGVRRSTAPIPVGG